MAGVDISKYARSPVHKAIILKYYAAFRMIIASLPQLCELAEIHIESVSVVEEAEADAISAVIDRRDVPNRDTPLHLAVKFGDDTVSEMLMLAGPDWNLQNDQDYSSALLAIGLGKMMQKVASVNWDNEKDEGFLHGDQFSFESSVIPFISRIAPSDTYKIWKRDANLRADMTLAGFNGFRILRSDQSILFLGDGSVDGNVPPGSLCMVSHKDKEVLNALDGAGAPATEAEVQQEQEGDVKIAPPRNSLYSEEEKLCDFLEDSPSRSLNKPGRHSVEKVMKRDEHWKVKESKASSSVNSDSGNRRKDESYENEYKKGLRPVVWLSPEFPLQTEELLPLLDILANKVKAIRRLRELLTSKLPKGTFPVKVAITVVPTIKVLVTFSRFEELQPLDEFSTPPSSPTAAGRESPSVLNPSNSSWFRWMKSPYQHPRFSTGCSTCRIVTNQDPFAIPSDYNGSRLKQRKRKCKRKSQK
ncbi:ankyrin repeat domain-containing 13C-like [Olea europaea subsp. europaea]|uniref:Ankyrin repeat domain-containing 13C-like n=1 Tax=Olea europaea subsp. europaea TaxID=158383 RepID=A0A8S0V0Q1_OLEEU|nr:ankyrin repeat domain-containing 13C-like [Olea europaea subsp. europaea]